MKKATLFLGTILPLAASAQTIGTAENELNQVADSQLGAPSFVSPISVRNSVEIRGGSDKEEASISFGLKQGSKERWNFTFTTPIDKEKKEGSFATLDGLSNSLRLKANYNRLIQNLSEYIVDEKGKEEICIRAGALYGWNAKHVSEKFYEEALCEDIALSDGSNVDLYNTSIVSPTEGTMRDIKAKLHDIRKEWLRAGMGYKHGDRNNGSDWVHVFRLESAIGSEEFKFIRADLISDEKERETEWSLGLGWRWVNFVDRYSIGLSYRRERIYDASDKVNICTETAVENVHTCKNLSINGPTEKEKDLAVLNYDLMRSKMALSALITYDLDEDEYGIEIPIYFIRNTDQAWNGGASFGWTSKDREPTAQIFIGVPFSGFD